MLLIDIPTPSALFWKRKYFLTRAPSNTVGIEEVIDNIGCSNACNFVTNRLKQSSFTPRRINRDEIRRCRNVNKRKSGKIGKSENKSASLVVKENRDSSSASD